MIAQTVAQLRSISPFQGVIDLLGFGAPLDGGGGRFFYDAASSDQDNGGTIIAPNNGVGRWKRIYSGAVHVDWFGANSSDATAAFAAASAFQEIECSPRTYLMNGAVSIRAGQVWRFNGATIMHTDNTKVMFSAVGVDGWSLMGPCLMQGTLTTMATNPEKAIYVSGCNKYRIHGVTARAFTNAAFHIAPGSYAPFKSDQGQWSDCAAYENLVGVQVDAGTGAEYNTFTNFNAAGNITGAQIAAGNTSFIGGSITDNVRDGVIILGGSNNGHGIFSAVNINHNAWSNVKADGVSNGFTFSSCHLYGDSATAGKIWFLNGTQDVCFDNCVIDAQVVHDSVGANRISNSKRYGQFSVTGSNPSGLFQVGNY